MASGNSRPVLTGEPVRNTGANAIRVERLSTAGYAHFKIGPACAGAGMGNRMVIVDIVVALVAFAAVLSIGIAFGRRALLGWYVHEVQRTEVEEAPDEAIVTYPLA